jgi:LmbE family N-acetylglucosaminyl deacetylase
MELSNISEGMWFHVLNGLPHLTLSSSRLVVVAPHPDDETLGAGGLIAASRKNGGEVHVVAVTDGEAAYPGVDDLGLLRTNEQEQALQILGVESSQITRLHLPDSNLYAHENFIADRLQALIKPADLVVAPSIHDYHPDHEICGRAALKATQTTGTSLVHYFFWTWHRGTPEDLRGLELRQFQLDFEMRQLRSHALARHRSQLQWPGREPILPTRFLAPMERLFEVFCIGNFSINQHVSG